MDKFHIQTSKNFNKIILNIYFNWNLLPQYLNPMAFKPMAKSNQSRFLLVKFVFAHQCHDKACKTHIDVHPITPRP